MHFNQEKYWFMIQGYTVDFLIADTWQRRHNWVNILYCSFFSIKSFFRCEKHPKYNCNFLSYSIHNYRLHWLKNNCLFPMQWFFIIIGLVGLGGLGVTCSPRDPRFASWNPAEVDGFFSGRKNPEHKSSGRGFKMGVPSKRFQAR